MSGARPLDVRIERTITLADQARERYLRIGVDVPPGVTSLQVDLAVADVDGAAEGGADTGADEGRGAGCGAVVDLGCEDPTGWRGWSGGAHRSFTISEDDASPGYLPGPLPAGRWHVVLGLHALERGEARVRVEVRAPAESAPDHGPCVAPTVRRLRGSGRALPAPPGLRWFAGDTHAHSLHSDGALSLDELAREAVRSGLDFLCVTDHGTTSHHAHLAEVGQRHGITLVPGQEITTHRGHANAYGEVGIIDARRPVEEWARAVAARGGFLSVNHPVAGDCSWLHGVPAGMGGVEILHSDAYDEPTSTAPFAWLRSVADARAARGEAPLSLLAGGDFHDPDDPVRPGTPTTWVLTEECTPAAIIAALAAGRTALTSALVGECGVGARADAHRPRARRPRENRPDLMSCPMVLRAEGGEAEGDSGEVQVITAAGLMLVDGDGTRTLIREDVETHHAPRAHGPYRLETPSRTTVAVCA